MFAEARQSEMDLKALGKRLAARKSELMRAHLEASLAVGLPVSWRLFWTGYSGPLC
jgi:hypothetical protein